LTGAVRWQPQGVIFDLDGTLADNMSWHAKAFETFLARHRLPPLTMELRRRIDGKTNADLMPILFGRALTAEELARYSNEKEGLYRELSHGAVQATRGAHRLLDALSANRIPVAIATSAPRENVQFTLAELGLANRFDAIARGEDVPRGKPAPDVFLHAAAALGVAPESCLAFEDAPVGVAAIRAAGMRCVALTLSFTPDVLAASDPPPHATYPDFDAFLAAEGDGLVSRKP
jgi:beta-phosphoglucomutase